MKIKVIKIKEVPNTRKGWRFKQTNETDIIKNSVITLKQGQAISIDFKSTEYSKRNNNIVGINRFIVLLRNSFNAKKIKCSFTHKNGIIYIMKEL